MKTWRSPQLSQRLNEVTMVGNNLWPPKRGVNSTNLGWQYDQKNKAKTIWNSTKIQWSRCFNWLKSHHLFLLVHRSAVYIAQRWPQRVMESPLLESFQLDHDCKGANDVMTKFVELDQLGGGFKFFFIFTPIWGRFPFWLIFFKGVETTN